MSKIKVIFWDIDATILNFEIQERNALINCFKKFNLGECNEEIIKEYSKLSEVYWEKMYRGEITKQQVLTMRFDELFANHNLKCDSSEFNNEFQIRLSDTIVFNDNADKLLIDLKKDFKQYIVTNGTSATQRKELTQGNMQQYFDDVFISEEIGFPKPDKRLFEYIKSRIPELKNDEIIIVGDSISSDITAGINWGIKSCWYNPKNKALPKDKKIDYIIKDLNELRDILYY